MVIFVYVFCWGLPIYISSTILVFQYNSNYEKHGNVMVKVKRSRNLFASLGHTLVPCAPFTLRRASAGASVTRIGYSISDVNGFSVLVLFQFANTHHISMMLQSEWACPFSLVNWSHCAVLCCLVPNY